MSNEIVTASPTAFDLGSELVPIVPSWILSGAPVTRARKVLRSHDWTSNLVVWDCTAGSFNWHYSEDELVVIVSGEVFVTDEKGEERRLGPGDLAFFPTGSSSKWRVPVHVRKIAFLRDPMWWPLGRSLKVWKKLLRMAGFVGGSPI